MGYSRTQFCEIRINLQNYGVYGLLDLLPEARVPDTSGTSKEIEQTVPDHSLKHPSHGSLRIS